MHASAAAGVVKGEVVHRKNFVEVDAMPRLNPAHTSEATHSDSAGRNRFPSQQSSTIPAHQVKSGQAGEDRLRRSNCLLNGGLKFQVQRVNDDTAA